MTTKLHPLYRGRIIQLNLENVSLPNGNTVELEIVHHPGGVAVLAEDAEGRLCLIRQFRHAAGGWLWEFPAGKREAGEQAEVTARRELLEEVGVEAANWHKLGQLVPSPGILTEVVHLYYARGLSHQMHAHEEAEVIEIHWFSLQTIEDMVSQGLIVDAKTLVGLYLLKARQQSGN
jgi:8-oxo-dGTP pyrophosphatase MutT (NUDIX family)